MGFDYGKLYSATMKELKKDYDLISMGTGRHVFALSDDLVYKKPKKSPWGIMQSLTEVEMYKKWGNQDLLCPIVHYNCMGNIVMRRAIRKLDDPRLPDEFKQFKRDLPYIGRLIYHEAGLPVLEGFRDNFKLNEERIEKSKLSPFYYDVKIALLAYDLYFSEITRPSNWGVLDGNLVIIDYGATNESVKKFSEGGFLCYV